MEMTSKQRLLAAIRLEVPDHVPCMPDFSNMIPCLLTGKPFWKIYRENDPELYFAYCRAAKHYGIDGWYQAYSAVKFIRENAVEPQRQLVSQSAERIVERNRYSLPGGELTGETTYYVADPPTTTDKLIKDLRRDFPLYKKLRGRILSADRSMLEPQRAACGDDGVFCLGVGYPGMQFFHEYMQGGATAAIYAAYDEPEIMAEWEELERLDFIRQAEILLDCKPDVLMVGGSGTLTLANPELVRRYALPTIQAVTRMAKQAGVPTMLHSCGKSMAFLDMLAGETDLCCLNPLEAPPMGDVDLAEVKRLYGHKLCLMGNLNTTELLLCDADRAAQMAREAIDAAGAGGGFILSTGDQLGRDTPPANIFKLVEVARTYGKYR